MYDEPTGGWIMALIVMYMMYAFILRPMNRRYEAALNHILGKEIARRLYQEIDPNFTYKAYQEENIQRHIILSSAVAEFRRFINKPTITKTVGDV